MASEVPGQSDRGQSITRFVEASLAKKDTNISWATATALVFLDEGRRLLLEAGNSNDSSNETNVAVAPRPDYLFDDLSYSFRTRALQGLGLVILGSVIRAIDDGKKSKGWHDRVYFASFEDYTRGTRVPHLSEYQLDSLRIQISQEDEEKRLLLFLRQDEDGMYTIFFRDYERLPAMVAAHMGTLGEEAVASFKDAADLYKGVARRLAMQPAKQILLPPPDQQKPLTEEQKRKLSEIDAMLKGTTKPINPEDPGYKSWYDLMENPGKKT